MKRYCSVIVLLALSVSSYAQQRYAMGLQFDNDAYTTMPKKARLTRALVALPPTASIKAYAPIPGDQGPYGTCVAWSVAYCGRTIVEAIKNNWTDKKLITASAYSAAFLFRMIRPGDTGCKGGADMRQAFELVKQKGVIPYQSLAVQCTPTISTQQETDAGLRKIKDYMRLFDINAAATLKIQAIKKSISEKKPVVIGMLCPPSFMQAKNVWQPSEQPDMSYGGHAMCVISYDDSVQGGAFELQNSWGVNWGNGGYIWVKYEDLARFVYYACEFVDLPEPRPDLPDLSDRIRLQLADGKEMPAGLLVSTRGLTVVPAKAAPGPLTFYQIAGSYTSGTRFRIYISNDQPAFVYAISSDLSNEVTKIFPYEEGISAALTDKKSDVVLPDEDHFIEFDNKPGRDLLCVLYSREELNINDIVKQISAQQGAFSERIYKVLKDKLADPKNITFAKDKIAFEGYSHEQATIVPLLVSIEHL